MTPTVWIAVATLGLAIADFVYKIVRDRDDHDDKADESEPGRDPEPPSAAA